MHIEKRKTKESIAKQGYPPKESMRNKKKLQQQPTKGSASKKIRVVAPERKRAARGEGGLCRLNQRNELRDGADTGRRNTSKNLLTRKITCPLSP